MTVRLRDGVEIQLSDGTQLRADARTPDGDRLIVSHAHADHLFDTIDRPVVCSPATADLAAVRREQVERTTDERIELVASGHIAGSRAAVVTDPDGTRYCYTGDVCLRDRLYLSGFDPPDADVLIVEATYGEPEYEFPPAETVVTEIRTWLAETNAPAVLFGYPLGRAQKLQVIAGETDRRVLVSEAIATLAAAMEPHIDPALPGEVYDDLDAIDETDVVILPSGLAGSDWVERFVDRTDAVTAGVSGWAVDESFRYRGGYDAVFPLSDHCDFPGLLELVERVDPTRVYTHHGAAESLAAELTTRGYDATALVANQHTLDDFG